jgi:hypothetical protein
MTFSTGSRYLIIWEDSAGISGKGKALDSFKGFSNFTCWGRDKRSKWVYEGEPKKE